MMKGVCRCFAVVLTGALLCGCALIEKPLTSRYSDTGPVSRPYAVEPSTIVLNDTTITYMEAGQGPWVILIHGGVIPLGIVKSVIQYPTAQPVLHSGAVATADSWNANIMALARNFHVAAIDLPGFGGSDKPDMKYKLEEFVIYLQAFMEAKGIESAMMVGHGLGGEIAIKYTLEHSEKVEKLVLVNSFGAWGVKRPHIKKSPLNLRWPVKYWQKEKAAHINICAPIIKRMSSGWKTPLKRLVEGTLSQKIEGTYPDNIIASREGESGAFISSVSNYKIEYITSRESMKEVHATHLALLETRRKDMQEQFHTIDKPVLIVQGMHDSAVPVMQARYMENTMPHARLTLYEKSGHYPMVEQADRFNRDLSLFLSDTVTAQAGK